MRRADRLQEKGKIQKRLAAGDMHLDDDEEWEDKKNTRKVEVSYACEDCDYRWEDVIIKKKNRLEDDEEIDVICPMCGSTNITQI